MGIRRKQANLDATEHSAAACKDHNVPAKKGGFRGGVTLHADVAREETDLALLVYLVVDARVVLIRQRRVHREL